MYPTDLPDESEILTELNNFLCLICNSNLGKFLIEKSSETPKASVKRDLSHVPYAHLYTCHFNQLCMHNPHLLINSFFSFFCLYM